MKLTFTPKATRELLAVLSRQEKSLALRIRCNPTRSGVNWQMSLEPHGPQTQLICGVPVAADSATHAYLGDMVVDWVQTPHGAGLGVYDRTLMSGDLAHAAD